MNPSPFAKELAEKICDRLGVGEFDEKIRLGIAVIIEAKLQPVVGALDYFINSMDVETTIESEVADEPYDLKSDRRAYLVRELRRAKKTLRRFEKE